MCIVAFAWQLFDEMPLCLISNRDEFYNRPTALLKSWPDTSIWAGQDLQSGGTWMGVTETGRWAVLTNFRDGQDQHTYHTSRGQIVENFLQSTLTPIRFAQALEQRQCDYAGFNLYVGDRQQAVYMSNRGEAPQVLAKGVYVVSNGLMSEHWEKTRHLRKRFTQELLPLLQLNEQQRQAYDLEYAVWDILEDQHKLQPEQLPNTGIAVELESMLSSTFIQSPVYGTRCSNFLTLSHDTWRWLEKTQAGEYAGHITELNIALKDKMPT